MVAFVLSRLAWTCLLAYLFLFLVLDSAIVRQFDVDDSRKMLGRLHRITAGTFFTGLAILSFYYYRFHRKPRPYPPAPGVSLLAIWVGSLTVYGLLLLPAFTRIVGRTEAALITRPFSLALNLVCTLALIAEGVTLVKNFRACQNQRQRAMLTLRALLIGVSAVLLVVLFGLHASLSSQIDQAQHTGFVAAHKIYLFVVTAQWLVNLALLFTPQVFNPFLLDSPRLQRVLNFGRKQPAHSAV